MRHELESKVDLNSEALRLLDQFKDVISDFGNLDSPYQSPIKDGSEDEMFSSPEKEEDEEEEGEFQEEQQKSPDMKSLLMAKLNEGRYQPKPLHYNIKKTIHVDSFVLNFGNFYPEKLLGSILVLSNLTDEEQIIELSIDKKTQIYDTDRLVEE